VTGSGMGNNGFNIFLDGALTPGSPFAYASASSTTVTVLVSGNGAAHSILVQDNTIPSCSSGASIVTPDCSNPCNPWVANFSYTTGGTGNLTLQFTDLTSGTPDQWLWGFGDGQTSFQQHPIHTYATPGVYNVCLIAGSTALNCYAPTYCSLVNVATNGVITPITARQLMLFPNPVAAQGVLYARGLDGSAWGEMVRLHIQDAHGRMIINEEIPGAEIVPIQMGQSIATGVYWVRIIAQKTVYIGKIIVD
jgi:PKD domain